MKAHFKSKAITITVEEEVDTTEYLNSNIENKKMLQKSLEDAKNVEVGEVNIEDL